MIMTDKTVELDQHRGMAAQKATKLRRLLADVETNEKALRARQEDLESHLLAAPAASWSEAAEKAGYLLSLFAATLAAEDPRRQKLIAAVLADFERLSGEE
jgi:prolyl-tRNA editing enzyme YbaK/EbsC (Cys-tRNA(Pro) deacylase)